MASVTPPLPAVTCTAQATYLTGHAARRARHRRQRLVLPRRVRGQVLAPVQPARPGDQGLGDRPRATTRASPAPRSSGGTTCTPRRLSPSRRARCTRPTGARSPTSTPSPPTCATTAGRARPVSALQLLGPAAAIPSTRGSPTRAVVDRARPTLTLVYLPHLDYNSSASAPARSAKPRPICAIDAVCGELIDATRRAAAGGRALRVRHRAGRPAGPPQPRAARGRPDRGARGAGHETARRRRQRRLRRGRPPGRARLRQRSGRLARGRALAGRPRPASRTCSTRRGKRRHLDHPRAGELVALAEPDAWFTYYYWLDDARAPTSRAPSTSIASRATTRSSCSSTRRSLPQAKVGLTLLAKGSASAT